jgi:penicillin-binding protein 1A
LRDLFPEDWKPNLKKHMLGLDAWVDFSLFRGATGAREVYERFSTFMDRFHVAGWRRGGNDFCTMSSNRSQFHT